MFLYIPLDTFYALFYAFYYINFSYRSIKFLLGNKVCFFLCLLFKDLHLAPTNFFGSIYLVITDLFLFF